MSIGHVELKTGDLRLYNIITIHKMYKLQEVRMIKIGILSLFLSANSGFAEIDFDSGKGINIKEVTASVETPAVSSPKAIESKDATKEWTVMVFVNGKNNLESYALKDVNEMEMVGSSDRVNIIAEVGRINGYSSADGDWKGCKRFYVTKDNDTNKINSNAVLTTSKCDMGSWEYMVDFVNWTKKNYPSKKYVLIIWNHGSGWDKGGDITAITEKGISYDDETGNNINTPQMRMALEKVGGVNILGMDACLMQMAEVAYEIKDYSDYVVASEETEPGDGYTYNTWLDPLVKEPTMDAKKLSVAMVNSYGDHYQSVNQGGTQSSISSKSLAQFTSLTNSFIDALIKGNDLPNAKSARDRAQKFYYSTNKDIYHFVKLVVDSTQVSDVKVKGQALLDFMKTNLIAHNRAVGSGYSNAYGIAGYLPTSYTTSYDSLSWAKDSKWDDLIKWINGK
jgi:hypothetical protein